MRKLSTTLLQFSIFFYLKRNAHCFLFVYSRIDYFSGGLMGGVSDVPCRALISCRMGLYDDLLPPRPPPRSGGKNEIPRKDEIEDEEWKNDERSAESSLARLFSFDMESGKEVNDLLPPLARRLTYGVDCYFEPTDRLVQNLVEKTSCHVEDACWALEACKGDITEAWTRISTARRLKLNDARRTLTKSAVGGDVDEDDWDEDSYEVEMEEEYLRLKAQRLEREKKRNIQDAFSGGLPDQNWLPKPNPRPIDDEPWFTG